MSYFLTFLGFAALIILHEAGHFAAAKWTGMRVERFSLFFGRTPLNFKRGETEYGVGWIPAGGFVKITGMSPVEVYPEMEPLGEATAALEATRESLANSRLARARAQAHVTELESKERGLRERVEGGGERMAVAIASGELERTVASLAETRAGVANIAARVRELEAAEAAQLQAQKRCEDVVAAVDRRAYINQPVWKRIVVILAGPAVNVLLAFLILAGVYLSVAQDTYSHGEPVLRHVLVASVETDSAASGVLKAHDRIVVVDGIRNPSVTRLVNAISSHKCAGASTKGCTAKTPVKLTVRRDGKLLSLSIRPRYSVSQKRMLIGFGIGGYFVTHYLSVLGAAGHSISEMGTVTSETVSRVSQLFKAKDRRQVHGIVGTVNVIQQEFSYSTTEAFATLGLISLSLAIINLFPFLPLDGGHVFWAVAEKLRGRRIPFAVMERAGLVGFGLILILFVIGLTNDISHPITIPH
jgi:regulator of sigma E protease